MLEYDDIDYTVDGIVNGCESVNIKYFNVLNDSEVVDNALWVIGDSNTTNEFTGQLWENIASEVNCTLFRDTIGGRTIAPASSIGIVDHIDSNYYKNYFEPFGVPKIICIQCGGNDIYWSLQEGNPLKMGDPSTTDKTKTYGALKYMLSYFNEQYPETKIIIATTKYRFTEDCEEYNTICDSFNSNLKTTIKNYNNVYLFDMGAKLWDYSEHNVEQYNTLFIADHIHFNTAGQQFMKEQWVTIINEIK